MLAHVEVISISGKVVGNSLIVPNDVSQYGHVKTTFFSVGIEPFFVQNTWCPVG